MNKNPFAYDENGKLIGADEIPVEEYGTRRVLTCPECGERLISVRRKDQDNGSWRMNHFSHFRPKGSVIETGCSGFGETAAHKMAKSMFEGIGSACDDSTGHMLALPVPDLEDAFPHDRGLAGVPSWAKHQVTGGFPLPPSDESELSVQIKSVHIERDAASLFIEGRTVPDIVVVTDNPYRDINGKQELVIAIEVMNTHAKSTDDVKRYSAEPAIDGVLEIDVSSAELIGEAGETPIEGLKGDLAHLLFEDPKTRKWLFFRQAAQLFASVCSPAISLSASFPSAAARTLFDESLSCVEESLPPIQVQVGDGDIDGVSLLTQELVGGEDKNSVSYFLGIIIEITPFAKRLDLSSNSPTIEQEFAKIGTPPISSPDEFLSALEEVSTALTSQAVSAISLARKSTASCIDKPAIEQAFVKDICYALTEKTFILPSRDFLGNLISPVLVHGEYVTVERDECVCASASSDRDVICKTCRDTNSANFIDMLICLSGKPPFGEYDVEKTIGVSLTGTGSEQNSLDDTLKSEIDILKASIPAVENIEDLVTGDAAQKAAITIVEAFSDERNWMFVEDESAEFEGTLPLVTLHADIWNLKRRRIDPRRLQEIYNELGPHFTLDHFKVTSKEPRENDIPVATYLEGNVVATLTPIFEKDLHFGGNLSWSDVPRIFEEIEKAMSVFYIAPDWREGICEMFPE